MGGWAEHDVFVDHEDNIWIAGNGHVVLKFNHTGRFQLQLGELWKTAGSNDPKLLGNPTSGTVDPSTNEVFIADGYANRRIIVFDARTGTYRRHWGAYGKRPVDGAVERFDPNGTPPQQFQPTHCVKIANDGLVYVCDRERNRIQVFRKNGSFLTEAFVAKNTATTGPSGAVSAIAFSADAEQRYVYVADHTNSKIWLLRRSDLFVLGSLDSPGNHGIATDSKGNLYTSGTLDRARVPLGPRRYTFKGVAAVPGDSAARP
jgi:DNA-binding beta-propeller fold protein YncE